MANIKYDEIKNLNISWADYAGQRVEEFIKKQLKMHVGYLYRTPNKINDYYQIIAFQCEGDFQKWQNSGSESLVLFRVNLPESDTEELEQQVNYNSEQISQLFLQINQVYNTLGDVEQGLLQQIDGLDTRVTELEQSIVDTDKINDVIENLLGVE